MKQLPPFGIDQWKNPTPMWAKRFFSIFFYTTSIITIVLGIFTEIPPHVQLIIAVAVIKANLLVKALIKLFGIKVPEYDDQQ